MKITELEIAKFRSIEHLKLDTSELTILCGANSSGKSNVLRAIRFAFVPHYNSQRLATNFPLFIASGNAMIRVRIGFDRSTDAIAAALGIPIGEPWTYEVTVKRSGFASFYINGSKIDPAERSKLLEHIWIVFVPPVRDIAGDGLLPFKKMLGDAIRQTRGGTPLAAASMTLRQAVTTKGRSLLAGSQFPPIGNLEVDVADVDFESMLSEAVINVRTPNGVLPLQGFGTGHQSQVVLGLYRQFGQGLSNFVLFQFEEPDNHMHTMAMRAIADDLVACSRHDDAQVFVTTHSPALMNQFELRAAIGLANNNGRTERRRTYSSLTDREYRVGLSQFGVRPAEALTARLVIVVEGATDVTMIRTLYRHHFSRDPERDDTLIVAAGGKEPAIKLSQLLNDLGVNWRCILDFDAARNESRPYFVAGIDAADKAAIVSALDVILPRIFSPSAKVPKSKKILNAMRDELLPGAARPMPTFNGSPIARLLDHLRTLSAVERSIVSKATTDGKHSKWRDSLWKSGIWLWSTYPEELLVQKDSALSAAEASLRSSNVLVGAFPNIEGLRKAVIGKLHGLAAEPEALEDALSAIFRSGSLGTDQFNALAARLRH